MILHPVYCFLFIDTESINFDHNLWCGGWLNFEFSKRENIRDSCRLIDNMINPSIDGVIIVPYYATKC